MRAPRVGFRQQPPGAWLPTRAGTRCGRGVRPQLLLGEYDVAVFVGMRSVEDRIRFLGGYEASLVGKRLAFKAFGESGRLEVPARR